MGGAQTTWPCPMRGAARGLQAPQCSGQEEGEEEETEEEEEDEEEEEEAEPGQSLESSASALSMCLCIRDMEGGKGETSPFRAGGYFSAHPQWPLGCVVLSPSYPSALASLL